MNRKKVLSSYTSLVLSFIMKAAVWNARERTKSESVQKKNISTISHIFDAFFVVVLKRRGQVPSKDASSSLLPFRNIPTKRELI